ncbi:hypothetical protein ABK905_06065 [Acerihabitans sp. KWT182]|uniref:ABC transporter permease n=1 Tax=Acerihabitans sp. KWT182 TaxID=3157919 RepID=A0AAU7QCD5_9GAMM
MQWIKKDAGKLPMPPVIRENASLYLVLAAVFLLMYFLNGAKFLSVQNFSSMAYQLPIVGFLSLGMMISMLSGGD